MSVHINVTITCDGPDGSHAEDTTSVDFDGYKFDLEVPK
jgi:hypothetical protein